MIDRDDKPTARALALELDKLTAEEVDMLAEIAAGLARGDRFVAFGDETRTKLERIGMKLRAHRSKGSA